MQNALHRRAQPGEPAYNPKPVARRMFTLRSGQYRIGYVPGTTDTLIISFSSIGQRRGLMPRYEFQNTVAAQGEHHALFVADKERTWLNAPPLVDDLCRAVASLQTQDGVRRVVTLGLSMGGYSALAAAHHFKVDAALTFSPQVSVHPDVMPGETRWRFWRRRITNHLLQSVSPLPDYGRFTLFHSEPDDMAHAEGFTPGPRLTQFMLSGVAHHDVARHVRQCVGLTPVLAAVIDDDQSAIRALARQAGATPR